MTERSSWWPVIEGALLIVLGVGLVVQSSYFQGQNEQQRRCLGDNFRELTVTLTDRAQLAAQESEANKRVWLVWADAAGIVRDDPTQPLPPKEQARLQRDLVAALLDFKRVVDSVEVQRRENPVPPYPAGSCAS